jgi:hypothetical protein
VCVGTAVLEHIASYVSFYEERKTMRKSSNSIVRQSLCKLHDKAFVCIVAPAVWTPQAQQVYGRRKVLAAGGEVFNPNLEMIQLETIMDSKV